MLTIAKLDRYDLVNTPYTDKAAFTVWFSGCSMECEGCYNQRLWDKSAGQPLEVNSVIFTICKECDHLDINDVVFIGGEPLEQDITDLTHLAKKLHDYNYNIWLYTGWEIDEIPDSLKAYLNTIKCGKYDETLKCDGIPSSTNQKFYRKTNTGWNEITFKE